MDQSINSQRLAIPVVDLYSIQRMSLIERSMAKVKTETEIDFGHDGLIRM